MRACAGISHRHLIDISGKPPTFTFHVVYGVLVPGRCFASLKHLSTKCIALIIVAITFFPIRNLQGLRNPYNKFISYKRIMMMIIIIIATIIIIIGYAPKCAPTHDILVTPLNPFVIICIVICNRCECSGHKK